MPAAIHNSAQVVDLIFGRVDQGMVQVEHQQAQVALVKLSLKLMKLVDFRGLPDTLPFPTLHTRPCHVTCSHSNLITFAARVACTYQSHRGQDHFTGCVGAAWAASLLPSNTNIGGSTLQVAQQFFWGPDAEESEGTKESTRGGGA